MKYNIAVLPGDGIGPEVTEQAIKVLNAIASKGELEFNYDYADIGAIAMDNGENPFPKTTEESCKNADAILLGAVGDPKYDDPSLAVRPEQGLLAMRKCLGLYANVRPVTLYKELEHLSPLKKERIEGVDFIVYRELTGGIYFGKKSTFEKGTIAVDECSYNVLEIQRIAKKAFDAAMQREKTLTLVDKANVLETSRLWRKTVNAMKEDYPEVTVEYMYVDNCAMQMIVNPKQFDVVLTENMFGDIITDEASVLGGSMGLMPSASIGDQYALFEPIHGSYPQAKGKDIANPMATILSAGMMLNHLGLTKEAQTITEAVSACISQGYLTEDLLPNSEFGTAFIGDLISAMITEDRLSVKPAGEFETALS